MQRRILFLFLLITSLSQAQTGVSGGLSLIKGFCVPKPYPGIHLGVEIPRDDEVSFFARITATLSNYVSDSVMVEAIDPMTSPQTDYKRVSVGMNYFNIEGGTRY